MNKISKHIVLLKTSFILALGLILTSCYSFTGGTLPEYMKTIYIGSVTDNSGFGKPSYKNDLTRLLLDKFKSDNSLRIVEDNGDSKLFVIIRDIQDATMTIKPGELESERKITVTCEAEFYDAVKKKSLWKRKFQNYSVYPVTDLQFGRDNAVTRAIDNISDDILLAVVSGW